MQCFLLPLCGCLSSALSSFSLSLSLSLLSANDLSCKFIYMRVCVCVTSLVRNCIEVIRKRTSPLNLIHTHVSILMCIYTHKYSYSFTVTHSLTHSLTHALSSTIASTFAQSFDNDDPLPSSMVVVSCPALRLNFLPLSSRPQPEPLTSPAPPLHTLAPFLVLDLQEIAFVSNTYARERCNVIQAMRAALSSE